MLRYWFRTLSLGVLTAQTVRTAELKLFGGIEPTATMGLFQIEIPDGKVLRDNATVKTDDYGLATGTLILRYSPKALALNADAQKALRKLLDSLTWLMFHLGGVGLGARRPYYSREDRQYAPWWRGSTLTPIPISNPKLWKILKKPEWDETQALQKSFQTRLRWFYEALATLSNTQPNPENLFEVGKSGKWAEALDKNCRIVCVQGNPQNKKPAALALLHHMAYRNGSYDRRLCGSINERSPIWISKTRNNCEIVTIFGVNEEEIRHRYLKQLQNHKHPVTQCKVIWPLSSPKS